MSAVAKIAHIRNPLTIIAMFAVIAEVSGTVVLPMLEPAVQGTYVWFLMFFPTGLVALFFYTLHTKRDALYGPGDYNDEKNFMDLIRPASRAEVAYKSMQDIEEAAATELEGAQLERSPEEITSDISHVQPGSGDQPSDPPGTANAKVDHTHIWQDWFSTAAKDALMEDPAKTFAITNVMLLRHRDREAAFAHLETLYGPIRRDMAVKGMIVDGLAGLNERPVVLEAMQYSPAVSHAKINQDVADLIKAAESLAADNSKVVTGLLVIIAEKRFAKSAKRLASRLLDPGRYPTAPRVKLDSFVFLVDDREHFLPSPIVGQ
ncbi:hypothetical protein ABFG95_06870 [Achromobacter sp. HNDS-1]|uniref:Uncharacterized protein n=1 Tax=Achromobacter sp. HNDS-1 TaxID=3151598 RepID=A0AAU7LEE7_9BURK